MNFNELTDDQKAKDAGATELPDGALEGIAGGDNHYLQGKWKCPKCGSQTVIYTAHMFFCDTCDWAAAVWPN